MKLKRTLFLSLFILTTFSGMIVSVNGVGTYLEKESGGVKFPPKLLDGNRIELNGEEYELPANKAYHIWQGWYQEGWTELSQFVKFNFKYRTMTLTINGEPVKLHTWKRHYKVIEYNGTTLVDVMFKVFYVEFKEDYFALGEYNFTLSPTNIPSINCTVNFY